jgi:quinolinate synthase
LEWPEQARLISEINRLKRERDAVILAHNYMTPEIFHGVGDYVGDSLGLAKEAARSDAKVIVQAGVHFMAETSKILSPEKTVLIPDLRAGCSLASSITGADVRLIKERHPGLPVVTYVNTTADVKAETDICCTSSNAVDVVRSIPEDTPILFCPDQFLGAHVRRETGRKNIHVWLGECHVHADISPADLEQQVRDNPEAELFVHPECGCTTSALWMASSGEIPKDRTHILSTGGMLDEARKTTAKKVLVATEVGMLHQLRKANQKTDFQAVNPQAACRFMQMITPPKLLRSLTDGVDEVDVDPETAARARAAVERMVAIGNPGTGE